VNNIRAMVRTLGAYGPVMLAHYEPDNGSMAVSEADLRAILTDRYLADVTGDGLFAMSFLDGANLRSDGLYSSSGERWDGTPADSGVGSKQNPSVTRTARPTLLG
jgi:hypothetical protein